MQNVQTLSQTEKERFDINNEDDDGADSEDAFDNNNSGHDNISNNNRNMCTLNVNEYHAVTFCQHDPIIH